MQALSSSAHASYTPHDPATAAREVRENQTHLSIDRIGRLGGWRIHFGCLPDPTRPGPPSPLNLTWRYGGLVPSSGNQGLVRSDLLRRAGTERYVGLDVSQEQTSVCVVDGSGKTLW